MFCKQCRFKENETEKFVGIFAFGAGFSTTNDELCGLFGCPVCHTVQFTTDTEYIKKRKEEYKLSHKK